MDSELARSWLAEQGVREVAPGAWTNPQEPGQVLTANDLAQDWVDVDNVAVV